MKNSKLLLLAAGALGASLVGAGPMTGPAAAHPLAPIQGLTEGSAVETVALRRTRRYHARNRVMGLVPGPGRRSPRIRLPR